MTLVPLSVQNSEVQNSISNTGHILEEMEMRNPRFQLVSCCLVGRGGMEQWFQMLHCPHNKELTCVRKRKLVSKLYFRAAEQITKQNENISMALLNCLLNTTCPFYNIRQ